MWEMLENAVNDREILDFRLDRYAIEFYLLTNLF